MAVDDDPLSRFRIKKLEANVERLCSCYLPCIGAISYSTFAVNVVQPKLFRSIFPRHHTGIASSFFFNAQLGIGLYLYSRPSLQKASAYQRVRWTVYLTAMFNFGSVLLWATSKNLLPEKTFIRILFAISSSLCYLILGWQYLDFVDSSCNSSHDTN
ncbi:uncharacterized protein LOC102805977 [Saccoglossus kowalevskii]|uniref:Uncharacterized protein LOC102805977 n=1 Tax=Saccoglossus kowalevskii TaxID=10224 RepID=A0ABM0MIQ9_SACKO|nr:PREDICTED: uncharacterized protein LOC102805977 [Saccoglossus kowalevskii]